ncbi:WD repeat-containing protein 36-like [Ciona intestinalis]
MGNQSKIFEGFKALGLHSSHIGHVIRLHRRLNDFYVIVPVGKVFHTYNCSKLGICYVSNSHPQDIECIAADSFLVYTGCQNVVRVFEYNTQIKYTLEGHTSDVHLIHPLGKHLISVDKSNCVKIWHVQTGEQYLNIEFSSSVFEITSLVHPSTYVNKVLFGSKQGLLQLWNVSRNKMLYEFGPWKDSRITCLEQSSAVDIIGVGTETGDILLLNLKTGDVLMKFMQDYGPVTCISFLTDGSSTMATGTVSGHICLWDLEEKILKGLMSNAHAASVAGLTFIPSQPLMVTNAADNTIKIWAFDTEDGMGRLLRERSGHYGPPVKVRFHDETSVISSGYDSTIRLFSCVHSSKDKNFGQASMNRAQAKKKGIRIDDKKLPPVVEFCIERARESQWDGLVAVHYRHPLATSWNVKCSRMGSHKFLHDRFKTAGKNEQSKKLVSFKNHHVTSVALTACGNFTLIGYSTGHLDMYNIQSGIHRGTYVDKSLGKTAGDKAHSASVVGVAVDALNQITVTAGNEKSFKFWRFKENTILDKLELDCIPSQINLHRDSGMVAVACNDFSVKVVDIDTRKVVRNFTHHTGVINDLCWSSDARWLITASSDCTVRTWDLPSATLIDCFAVDNAVTSLTLSPNCDMLATSHVDDLGVYIWSNRSLYSHISLQPLPLDFEPDDAVDLPLTIHLPVSEVAETPDEEKQANEDIKCEQLESNLITLACLPQSRWANLLQLDVIKQRNKPKEAPKVPKSAPFFLPTASALVPSFITDTDVKDTDSSKITSLKSIENFSEFAAILNNCSSIENYSSALEYLKKQGPSAIDTALRSLDPFCGGSNALLEIFLDFVEDIFISRRDFEAIQAYFGLFLKIHADTLASIPGVESKLERILTRQEEDRKEISYLLNQAMCVTNFIKSAGI